MQRVSTDKRMCWRDEGVIGFGGSARRGHSSCICAGASAAVSLLSVAALCARLHPHLLAGISCDCSWLMGLMLLYL